MIMSFKTPVSILQEEAAKRSLQPPHYELVHSNNGTHLNSFQYRVIYDNMVAYGSAYSKKDAKHEAAKEMLAKLGYLGKNFSGNTAAHMDTLQHSTEYVPNHTAKLKAICIQNELQVPEFKIVSCTGPPHDPIFTMRCKVLQWTAEGCGKSKKEAENVAAAKTIELLDIAFPINPIKPKSYIVTVNHEVDDGVKDTDSEKLLFKVADLSYEVSKMFDRSEKNVKLTITTGPSERTNHSNTRSHVVPDDHENRSRLEPTIVSDAVTSANCAIPQEEKPKFKLKETVAEQIATTSRRSAELKIQENTKRRENVAKLQAVMEWTKIQLKDELENTLAEFNLQMNEMKARLVLGNEKHFKASVILNTIPEITAIGSGSTTQSAEINAIVEAMEKFKLFIEPPDYS